MYEDYPTIYETTINQNYIYFIILGIILLLMLIVSIISLAKIFKKANRSGISAIIPIYNIFVLLEIVNLPKYYFLLTLIPGVNIVIYFTIMTNLAKLFRKSKLFAVGLVFLPFIFYPILAFGKSEYIGINLVAMERKNMVVNIPQLENDEESIRQVNETLDENAKNTNISIGGGVYQKSYTKSLLDVDNNQAIYQNPKKQETSVFDNKETQPSMEKVDLLKVEPVKEVFKTKPISVPITDNLYSIDMPQLNQNNNTEIKNEIPQVQNQVPIQSANVFTQCPKCGAQVKQGAITCFLCGQKLN